MRTKDELRKAESLNAIKQHALSGGNQAGANTVSRFQNPVDSPYRETYGAAALFSTQSFDKASISQTAVDDHPHKDKLVLLIIRGAEMMALVHELYRRAADEA